MLLLDTFDCEDSFVGHNGHCYRLLTNSYTYVQAQLNCKNYGGYLVEIENQEEQDFVEGKNIATSCAAV